MDRDGLVDAGREHRRTPHPDRSPWNAGRGGRLIAYLASESAAYVTGQSVVVDGGNMIQEPHGVDLYDADDTDT